MVGERGRGLVRLARRRRAGSRRGIVLAGEQARHELLAAFGHDLRAPLARLIHASRAPPEAGDDEAAYRAGVAASARQQLALIDALLDYTRHALAPPEVVGAPMYVFALLDEAAREARSLAAASGASVRIAVADGAGLPPLVVFDAMLLRQVLRRLLACAVRQAAAAAPTGTPAPLVLALETAGPAPSDDRARLRFSVGAALLPDLAPPFDAAATVMAAGSGEALDLALADQLLRAAGSRLQCDATGDIDKRAPAGQRGRRFYFDIETAIAAESDAMLPLPVLAAGPPAAGPGRRILLVDTAPAMLDYLSEVLDHAGFEADRADGMEEALALYAAQPFALILCGHQPPALDAWELLRRLGASEGMPAPPVLLHALTPPGRPAAYPQALDFAAVMYRPASADLLLSVLAALDGN
jgi:CheY-like chemotaxis protein